MINVKQLRKAVALILGLALLLPIFLQIQTVAAFDEDYVAVTNQVLRSRDSDRASSNGYVAEGSEVQFLEAKGNDWFKVRYEGQEGYVLRGELTSLANYHATGPAKIHPTKMKSKERIDRLVLTIDVNLRSKDENHYRPIRLLKRGTEVSYQGTTAKNWFKVSHEGQEGYLYRGDLTTKENWEDDSEDKSIHPSQMAQRENFNELEVLLDVNLRTKDNEQYRPIELLRKGSIVQYLGSTAKNWFKVQTENGQEGYVYRGSVTRHGELLEQEMKVHYLDVGQGDSTLIELPNDEVVLIDAGIKSQGETKVANYLDDLGIQHIDYLIGTHPHNDHIGGMTHIVQNYSIGKIYMPKISHTTNAYRNLLEAIAAKGYQISNPMLGSYIVKEKNLTMNILAPDPNITSSNLNEHSIANRLVYGGTSFIFTGDAEKISEETMVASGLDLSADVLKVGHHGGNTSSLHPFLEKVGAQYAVVSAGLNNQYNHPHPDVLSRLAHHGMTVYRTDQDGTVIASSNGQTIWFNQ